MESVTRMKQLTILLTFIILSNTVSAFVINHDSVDLYDDIPSEYMDEVKTMRINILGESHSTGYIKGLNLLEQADLAYSVIAQESGATAPTTAALRADRARRSIYNSWQSGAGENRWYTNEDDREDIKFHLDWSNDNNYDIAAVGFGWCWDMTWHNSVGGGVDPVYNVRWAGSSVGGPEGDLRWGLDDADTSLTGNSINMDTYLAATENFQDHVTQNGDSTIVFFTTGPVDGGGNSGERGYQRYIKHQHIRNYVNANDKILFDYADILTHDESGNQNLISWDGHSFPYIHPNNMLDIDGTYAEDGDHIGERGAVRLAKAQWVMLAMIAGWNPGGTSCGDSTCASGECNSCPQDCDPNECCPDGTCNNGETCDTCEEDCGPCITCIDNDTDGYGNPADSTCTHPELDCNDNNQDINPGETEICSDSVDSDCTGSDLICSQCSEGSVGSRCLCGGTAYENGHCCDDVWQSGECSTYQGSIHYIRDGSSGDGSDWANALDSLPDVLERDHTYYIADGNYSTYVFNDAEQGAEYIYIKKAVGSDHGTDVGWQSNFGDEQAVFSTDTLRVWRFDTGYYSIDGQIGTKDSGHGFLVSSSYYGDTSVTIIAITGATGLSNFKFNHIEGHHMVPCYETGCYPSGSIVFYSPYGASDIEIRNCYFHDTYYHANMLTRSNRNILIEDSFFENVFRKETLSDYYSEDVVIRNNIFKNTAGSGIFIFKDINNWSIYNNLFYWTDDRYTFTDAFIGTWTNEETGSYYIKIFGNTFANYDANGGAMGFKLMGDSENNEVYNNIFYNCQSNIYHSNGNAAYFFRGFEHDYNWFYDVYDPRDTENEGIDIAASETHGQYGTGDPFVGSEDFHLTSATDSGLQVDVGYDLEYAIRGADGVWDRGAYEFSGSGCTPVHPADTDCVSGISLTELIAYIDAWKTSDVSLQQVMGAIVVWKG